PTCLILHRTQQRPVVRTAAEQHPTLIPRHAADQTGVALDCPALGRPHRARTDDKHRLAVVNSSFVQQGARVRPCGFAIRNPGGALTLLWLYAKHAHQAQDALNLVALRLTDSGMVVDKPACALAKSDPVGNPGQSEKESGAQRLVRGHSQSELLVP